MGDISQNGYSCRLMSVNEAHELPKKENIQGLTLVKLNNNIYLYDKGHNGKLHEFKFTIEEAAKLGFPISSFSDFNGTKNSTIAKSTIDKLTSKHGYFRQDDSPIDLFDKLSKQLLPKINFLSLLKSKKVKIKESYRAIEKQIKDIIKLVKEDGSSPILMERLKKLKEEKEQLLIAYLAAIKEEKRWKKNNEDYIAGENSAIRQRLLWLIKNFEQWQQDMQKNNLPIATKDLLDTAQKLVHGFEVLQEINKNLLHEIEHSNLPSEIQKPLVQVLKDQGEDLKTESTLARISQNDVKHVHAFEHSKKLNQSHQIEIDNVKHYIYLYQLKLADLQYQEQAITEQVRALFVDEAHTEFKDSEIFQSKIKELNNKRKEIRSEIQTLIQSRESVLVPKIENLKKQLLTPEESHLLEQELQSILKDGSELKPGKPAITTMYDRASHDHSIKPSPTLPSNNTEKEQSSSKQNPSNSR